MSAYLPHMLRYDSHSSRESSYLSAHKLSAVPHGIVKGFFAFFNLGGSFLVAKAFPTPFQDSKAAPGWISQLDGSKEDLPEIRLGLAKVLAPLPLCEAGW